MIEVTRPLAKSHNNGQPHLPPPQNQSAKIKSQELAALLEISRNIVSLDTKPLLGLVLDQLKTVVGYTGGVIAALNGADLIIQAYRGPLAQKEIIGRRLRLKGTGFREEVLQHRNPIIVDNIWGDDKQARSFRLAARVESEPMFKDGRAWMGIPLVVKNQMIGMLALLHQKAGYYTPEHAKQALIFANQVAVSLENDRLYQQIHQLVTLEERERLAREMHDQLAQAIGLLNMQASVAYSLLEDEQIEEAQQKLEELKELAGNTYTDIREDIFNLRTTVNREKEFLTTLRTYLDEYETYYGLSIDLILEDEVAVNIPADKGLQIIRIIQEALSNVRKHTEEKQAEIRFEDRAKGLQIIIQDHGSGFDLDTISQEKENSFGLQIMKERAESIGGTLEVQTSPGEGTQLAINLVG